MGTAAGPHAHRTLAGHLRRADRERCLPTDAQEAAMSEWVKRCRHCDQFYAKSGVSNHERKCPAARATQVAARVLPVQPCALGSFESISQSAFDWVDSVSWEDTQFFGTTLVPSSSCKDYWLHQCVAVSSEFGGRRAYR